MLYFLRLPFSVLGAFWLCLATAPAFSSQSGQPSGTDVPDAFKIYSSFLAVAAVRDVNPNPIFKCVTATRESFDSVALVAAYRWTLNIDGSYEAGESLNRELILRGYGTCLRTPELLLSHPLLTHTPGPTPDTVYTVVNGDTSHALQSRFTYTDYSTCAILEMSNFGPQCTLWVRPDLRDSIPESCSAKYAELCGEGVSLYDKGTC